MMMSMSKYEEMAYCDVSRLQEIEEQLSRAMEELKEQESEERKKWEGLFNDELRETYGFLGGVVQYRQCSIHLYKEIEHIKLTLFELKDAIGQEGEETNDALFLVWELISRIGSLLDNAPDWVDLKQQNC